MSPGEPYGDDAQDLAGRWREAYARGEHARILEPLRRAIAADPGDAGARYMLGCSLLALGQAAQAAEALGEAARLEPESQEAHFQLGVALQALTRHDEALGQYREALRLRLRDEALPDAPARPGPRVPVTGTTLCCVDCRNHELAVAVLRRTLAQCRFDRVLFLTNRPFDLPGIETRVIPDIGSIADYCRFMIRELGGHIDTPHALVVQYDGYVLNGKRWDARFTGYDYVGAPWGEADGGRSVGNGGFSLRSRKLLDALRDPRIAELVPEDVAICKTYRRLLEGEYGIRFAPPELAELFSFESLTPPGPTFGFHGISHMVRVLEMSEEELAVYRPPPMRLYTKG